MVIGNRLRNYNEKLKVGDQHGTWRLDWEPTVHVFNDFFVEIAVEFYIICRQ